MIRVALMNRHYKDFFAELTGRALYSAVALRLRGNRNPKSTHAVLLWFFPAYFLSLTIVYFVGAMTAFACLYWGMRSVRTWQQAFLASGSGLNTLGFATPVSSSGQWLSIPEGALGLGIVVFLFTFIPTYQAVIRLREDRTSWLYTRIGDQPTGLMFLEWCQRTGVARNMREVWESWENWFRTLADTHAVLPLLSISPSVQSGQSWVLAAAAVLDAAALAASTIQTKDEEAAKICIRTGTRALLAIADALGRASTSSCQVGLPSKESYDIARARLRAAGILLRQTEDREAQWQMFLSLRDSYEEALLFIARRTFIPTPQSGEGIQLTDKISCQTASPGPGECPVSAGRGAD
jgi:hypothetical protein